MPWAVSGYATQWAIYRYIWSFLPPPAAPVSKLTQSPYTDGVAGRQRGIWTEDIGIGVAQKLLRASLGPGDYATPLLDSDIWLERLVASGDVTLRRRKSRPDYISFRWLAASGPELLFVECKGRTTHRDGLARALCAGVKQLKNVTGAVLPVRRWAVGAGLQRAKGTWEALAVEVDERRSPVGKPAPAPTVLYEEERFAAIIDAAEVGQALIALGDLNRARQVTGGERLEGLPDLQPFEVRSSDRDDYVGRTLELPTTSGTLSIYFGIDAERASEDRQASIEKRRATRGREPEVREIEFESGDVAFASDDGTVLSVALS